MNINVSKEVIATIASVAIISTFFLGLFVQIGGLKGEIGELRGEMGELRGEMGRINGAVEANGRAIESLRDDMRELRGIITSHLATHAAQGEVTANANE